MDTNGIPRIDRILPGAAIPGGDVTIYGSGFVPRPNTRPLVRFGETEASLLISAQNHLIARVPDGAAGGIVSVETSRAKSQPFAFHLGVQIADNLHPVANPAVDVEGNIYVTYSGQRGQQVAVSLYKITANYTVKPFVTELMNPTGLALDREGYLYVSCRNDGTIHRVTPDGRSQLWVEGMGTATGIAFDTDRQPVRRRPQRHDFQDQPQPGDFRFCDARAFRRGVPSGVQPDGRTVCDRPNDVELRPCVSHQSEGRDQHFFSRTGQAAGTRVRPQEEISTSPHRTPDAAASCESLPMARPSKCSAAAASWASLSLPGNRAILATSGALFSLDWDVEGLPLPR